MKDNVYEIQATCSNCGKCYGYVNHFPTIEVEKGTETKDVPCPNCGCKTLTDIKGK